MISLNVIAEYEFSQWLLEHSPRTPYCYWEKWLIKKYICDRKVNALDVSNKLRIPYSTARSLFQELMLWELSDLEAEVKNKCKQRYESLFKEFLDIYLNSTTTWFTIGDIVNSIKTEFTISMSERIIRSWVKDNFK